MKKILFFVSALAGVLFAGSCQREELAPAGENGVVTFEVGIPENATRVAVVDNGTNINDLVYAVYRTSATSLEDAQVDENIQLIYQKNYTTNPFQGSKAVVPIELINDQNYLIVFWAQVEDAWVKGDSFNLMEIGYPAEMNANDSGLAAFTNVSFIRKEDIKGGAIKKTVELTRPFAQIRIGTTLPKNVIEAVKLKNSSVKVTGAAEAFNVLKQAAGEESCEVEFKLAAVPDGTINVNNTDYKYAAMNYIFANGNVGVAFNIETENHGTVITEAIPDVPVQRNYRTNIVGNLLTSEAKYTVTLEEQWDSEYVGPEFVQVPAYNAETQTWTVTNADELAWVAASVNGTIGLQTKAGATSKTFKGEKVVLANDIDLQGKPWIPIGNGDSANRYEYLFGGTFDGQGHSIKNMNVDYTECAGLFGRICGATIKNVTIDGFNLKSDHYAGAIIGWAETGAKPITVENCKALNGTITVNVAEIEDGRHDLGDKAGAIVGYSHHGNYTNNEVNNVIIEGYRDLGAIVGYGNNSVVTDNKIANVTLVQNLECDYKKDEEGGSTPNTIDHFVGRKGGTCTIDSNTGEAKIVTAVASGVYASGTENGDVKEYSVYAAEGLKWIAANVDDNDGFAGKTVKLTHDIDCFNGYMPDGDPVSTQPIGQRDYTTRDNPIGFKGTFDGNNHAIKNLYQNGWALGYWEGQYGAIGLFSRIEGATIKNLTMDGCEMFVEGGNVAVIAGNAEGNCTFENITIKNSTVGSYNNGAAGIVAWSETGNYTFKNIILEETFTVASLWGFHGAYLGGIIAEAYADCSYKLEDIVISCRLDAYNDVVSNYQWYAYRCEGMIVGNVETRQTIGDTVYPDPAGCNITCSNVIVNYGDWMNYHYCESPEFGKPSYADEREWKFKRVEPGFQYGGIEHTKCNHGENESHYVYIPFNQLFGGGPNGYGNDPVYGLVDFPGVTVNYPASYRREVSTAAALTEALGKGVSVILDADIDFGSTQLAIIGENQVVDLGGHALTTANNWGGISLKNGATIKNGTITHAGNTAAIKAFAGTSVENVTINATCATADKTVTGIAVQQGANVESIKNVTINGVSQGIEVGYQATVGLIENAVVNESNNGTAKGIGLVINGGKVGKAKDCTFKGETYGITMHLKGVFAAGLELENCTVEGTTASIYAWDEKGISNTSGSLVLTYDAATTLTGPFVWDFEDECKSVVTLNKPQ